MERKKKTNKQTNKNIAVSVRVFLAKNTWGILQICLTHIAVQIIPVSLSISGAKHVTAFFFRWIVWLPTFPIRILARKWSVINPVELIVCLSVETKPHAPSRHCLLLLRQVKDKFVFVSRFDYGKVSSQILAGSSSVAPLQGWNVDDEVA